MWLLKWIYLFSWTYTFDWSILFWFKIFIQVVLSIVYFQQFYPLVALAIGMIMYLLSSFEKGWYWVKNLSWFLSVYMLYLCALLVCDTILLDIINAELLTLCIPTYPPFFFHMFWFWNTRMMMVHDMAFVLLVSRGTCLYCYLVPCPTYKLLIVYICYCYCWYSYILL